MTPAGSGFNGRAAYQKTIDSFIVSKIFFRRESMKNGFGSRRGDWAVSLLCSSMFFYRRPRCSLRRTQGGFWHTSVRTLSIVSRSCATPRTSRLAMERRKWAAPLSLCSTLVIFASRLAWHVHDSGHGQLNPRRGHTSLRCLYTWSGITKKTATDRS